MNIGILIFIVIIAFFLIYRRLTRKVRGSDCGAVCQLLQKPSPPLKLESPKETRKEIKKRMERIQADEKRRKEKGEPIKLDWLENYGKKKEEEKK